MRLPTPVSPSIAPSPARLRGHVSRGTRLLLLIPAVDLVFMVGIFVSLGSLGVGPTGGDGDSAFGTLIFAYNLLPPVTLAVFVLLAGRFWPRGWPVTVVTCLLLSGVLGAAMLDMGSSSTGVLVLLFVPMEFCFALFPFGLLGVLVHWLRGRRAAAET